MSMTKADILAEFEVLAKIHYDGDVPQSVTGLLPRLVNNVLSELDIKKPTFADELGIVFLIGEIDEEKADGDGGVIDQLYAAHLELPPEREITLIISSEGGDVGAGFAIIGTINSIRRKGRKVNAHITGWAHSVACDIVQHCDYRTADPIASLMMHEEQYGSEGSTSDHAVEVQFSRKQVKAVCEIVATRTGKPAKYYEEKIRHKDWYLTAKEALAEQLIDAIVPIPELPKPTILAQPKRRTRKKASEEPVGP